MIGLVIHGDVSRGSKGGGPCVQPVAADVFLVPVSNEVRLSTATGRETILDPESSFGASENERLDGRDGRDGRAERAAVEATLEIGGILSLAIAMFSRRREDD